ncbi:hypothetical protein CCP2SC5_70028 [Azospirillaceae bacterium]
MVMASHAPSFFHLPEIHIRQELGGSLSRWLLRGVETIEVWHERVVTRRCLAGMDEHQLQDIGLSSGDAIREYEKPFWRA